MRFEKGHKEATRQKIIETAAARFRKDGIAAVGIAGLMADAGLTHGGFYAHFGSKEELVREALMAGAAGSRARLERAGADAASGLESYIRAYLRPAHRDAPERGCIIATLGAELARHAPETRMAFSAQINTLLDRIAEMLPADRGAADRRAIAIGIFGVLSGTLQLARAVTDPDESGRILESGVAAALKLAE